MRDAQVVWYILSGFSGGLKGEIRPWLRASDKLAPQGVLYLYGIECPSAPQKPLHLGTIRYRYWHCMRLLGLVGTWEKNVKRVSQAPPVQRHNELLQVQYECVSTYPTCQLADHQSRSQGTLGRLCDVNVCSMGKDDL